jgi:hypothetical protein
MTNSRSWNRTWGAVLLSLAIGTIFIQVNYVPIEQFERPKTEFGRRTELQFSVLVTVAYSWATNEAMGMTILRNVDPVMEVVRTSGSRISVEMPSLVLIDKWEYLNPGNSNITLEVQVAGLEVSVSHDVFPSKLNDQTSFAFGISTRPSSPFYDLREVDASLMVRVVVGPCEVGESTLRCPFVDFSGGSYFRNDWRNADLRLAQFDGSDLRSARFDGADLSGAIFVGANTEGASFERSNLFGAIFE